MAVLLIAEVNGGRWHLMPRQKRSLRPNKWATSPSFAQGRMLGCRSGGRHIRQGFPKCFVRDRCATAMGLAEPIADLIVSLWPTTMNILLRQHQLRKKYSCHVSRALLDVMVISDITACRFSIPSSALSMPEMHYKPSNQADAKKVSLVRTANFDAAP